MSELKGKLQCEYELLAVEVVELQRMRARLVRACAFYGTKSEIRITRKLDILKARRRVLRMIISGIA